VLAFILDGFRASNAHGPMPAPPTPAQMDRVLNTDLASRGVAQQDTSPSPAARS
jgi:hypothetical protein